MRRAGTSIAWLATGAMAMWLCAASARADGESPGFVIGPGHEKQFLDMTDPKPAKFPGGYALDEVSIQQGTARLSYVNDKGQKAQLSLAHPGAKGTVLGQSAKFALIQEGPAAAPKELVDALLLRLHDKEGTFDWTSLTPPVAKGGDGADASHEIPTDAMPAERLPQREYPMPDGGGGDEVTKALAYAREGKTELARQGARDIQKHYPNPSPSVTEAVAMILRASGDGGGAALLLAPLLDKAQGADADRLRMELAASYEQANQPAQSQKILAALATQPAGGAACARAEALTMLVQDGRAHDVLRLTDADWQKGPRCMIQMRMRAAISANDPKALDAAGAAAVAANAKDEDLLYLWGWHYYDRQELQQALLGWDQLARVNPDYRGFLSLYATTYQQLGMLQPKNSVERKFLARAKGSPGDVVANFLGGIGLYYDKKYKQAMPLFEAVLKHHEEPRAAMYLAMSHFFTGNVADAMKMLDALEPAARREPDIYYSRSLVYRFYDLPRAIKEMQGFLDVVGGEKRPAYGHEKIDKAKDDLAHMKNGEVPSVYPPGQGSYTPPPLKK